MLDDLLVDELLGGGPHLGEGARRLVRVEAGLGELGLVVEEDRVRDRPRHRPLHPARRVVRQGPGQVRGGVVARRLDARLGGHGAAAVDHLLDDRLLHLHQVGQVAALEAGLVLREGVLVVRLLGELDVDLVLGLVERLGCRLQPVEVGADHRVPEEDLDRLLGPLQLGKAAVGGVHRGVERAADGVVGRARGDRPDEQARREHRCHERRPPAHPFTAPAVRPRTRCFWKKSSRMNSGRAASTVPAKVTLIWSIWVPRR